MAKLHKLLIIMIAVVSLLALSLFFMFDPEQVNIFPPCPFHVATGFHCPGCGSQRAIHSFMHGDFTKAFQHNFLILLLIIVLIYEVVIYTLNWKFNKQYYNLLHHPNTTRSMLVLIILFWILRNINSYPFNILAP